MSRNFSFSESVWLLLAGVSHMVDGVYFSINHKTASVFLLI